MFDKFHDECGVFAIYGHPEAANLAYLGLYALQHRGQESAGICSSDGRQIHCHKSNGPRGGYFHAGGARPACRAIYAIGHTRYSTAGDTVLLNAQPFSVACNKGQHRGGAQRQHHQRGRIAAGAGTGRVDLSSLERYRSDSASGGAVAGADARRRVARGAAAAGRRVFTGISGRRPRSWSRAIRMDSGRWRSGRWSCRADACATCSRRKLARST